MLQIALLIMVASDSSFVAGVPARRSPRLVAGPSNGAVAHAATAANGVPKRARSPARAAAPRLVAAAASADDGARSPLTQWVIRNRSLLLLLLLVVHKSVTDSLTRYTRVQGAYSASTVAMMAEIFKFPLIISAIASIGGGLDQVIPTFRMALAAPLGNAWIALCYTFNNLLYFPALSSLSAVAYQVLSQSKTLFTAGMMYFVVGKKLTRKQVGAAAAQFCLASNSARRNSRTPRNSLTPRAFPLAAQVGAVFLLIAGALMVQFQELGTATAVAGVTTSAVYWAAFLTLFSSFISALPNVVYEKVLKAEGANQWVNNVQVTWWIIIWVTLAGLIGPLKSALGGAGAAALAGALPPLTLSGLKASFVGAFAGFTPAVWGVVVLKALNGLIIPATFKYADNIVYSYAKPSSIVVTTVLGAVLAGQLPAPSLVAGVALVLFSIQLYSSKPKEE